MLPNDTATKSDGQPSTIERRFEAPISSLLHPPCTSRLWKRKHKGKFRRSVSLKSLLKPGSCQICEPGNLALATLEISKDASQLAE